MLRSKSKELTHLVREMWTSMTTSC